MNLRGGQLQRKVKIKWSSDFAYAIGLITSDGNLSKDGRHIGLISKDLELISFPLEEAVLKKKATFR